MKQREIMACGFKIAVVVAEGEKVADRGKSLEHFFKTDKLGQ